MVSALVFRGRRRKDQRTGSSASLSIIVCKTLSSSSSEQSQPAQRKSLWWAQYSASSMQTTSAFLSSDALTSRMAFFSSVILRAWSRHVDASPRIRMMRLAISDEEEARKLCKRLLAR